jgi:small GTP-binding protein
MDFTTKTIDDEYYGTIEFFIWDTSGAEKFNCVSLTQTYYRGAQGVIIVFDVTRRESFTHISEIWLPRLRSAQTMDSQCKYILVGNKVDLNKSRQVSQEEASDFARESGMAYMELSSLYSVCSEIRKPFLHLAVQLMDDKICQPRLRKHEPEVISPTDKNECCQ